MILADVCESVKKKLKADCSPHRQTKVNLSHDNRFALIRNPAPGARSGGILVAEGLDMTNGQLVVAIIGSSVLNTALSVSLYLLLNAKMEAGFAAINTRFDDMRDLWRAELTRVEQVLDARLKNLEER